MVSFNNYHGSFFAFYFFFIQIITLYNFSPIDTFLIRL